jgi:hypothetical protein
MLDVIKSYLVSLGFSVNDAEFNKATQSMNDLNKTITSVTAGMAKQFAVAGTEVVGVLATITGATGALIKETAELDMQYQKFALRMWMAKDSAKDLQVTLKAMGESVEDVAWIPELRQQYFQLINQGNEMKTPGDAGEQLKYIRSILFEFTRLKLEVSYAAEWISYYLIKYLSGPLAKIKESMQGLNGWIVQKMPEWTNKVAKVLSMIVTLFINVGRFIYDAFMSVERFFMAFPKGLRLALGAIAALTLAFKMNPILLALTTAILLIDDFYSYLDGRKSLKMLQPVWAKIIEWSKDFNKLIIDNKENLSDLWNEFLKSATYKNMIDALKNSFEALKEGLLALKEIFDEFMIDLGKSIEKKGLIPEFKMFMQTTSQAVDDVAESIKKLMIQLHLLSNDTQTKSFMQWFSDEIAKIAKNTMILGEVLSHVFSAVAKAAVGDVKGATKEMTQAMVGVVRYTGENKDSMFLINTDNGGITNDAAGRDLLRRKIAQQESHGDPQALSYDEAHFGKYQFGQSTWDSAASDANRPDLVGIDPRNVSESDQDLVAQTYINELMDKFGGDAARVAGSWYAGEGSGEWSEAARNRKQVSDNGLVGPSVNEYAMGVLKQQPTMMSYTGMAQNGMSTLAGSYAQPMQNIYNTSAGEGNVIIESINLSFGGTNATVAEIQQATIAGVQQATGKQVARQTRDMQGVFA